MPQNEDSKKDVVDLGWGRGGAVERGLNPVNGQTVPVRLDPCDFVASTSRLQTLNH